MISIQIFKKQDSLTKAIIKGHSGSKGSSIECAAISYLVQSVCGFLRLKDFIICKDNKTEYFIDLKLLKEYSNDIFEYLVFSFQLIARDYPENIKFEILEENNGS